MTNYIALIAVPVGETTAHVAFKLPAFRSPVISDEVVDVLGLIKVEKPLLEQLAEEWKSGEPDPEKLARLQANVKLPAFLSSYVEAGQTSNAIFDILPGEEFAEATIGESKVNLKSQNEILAARVAQLENELAQNQETK